MITVNFLVRWMNFEEVFGISRYQTEIHKRLEDKIKIHVIGYKRGTYLQNNPIKKIYEYYIKYPIILKIREDKNGIYHISHALYAYMSRFLNPEKTIVTCFDIEPSIMFGNLSSSVFWTLNILGLKRCRFIITISEYSKKEILRFLGFDFPENKIRVIYEGVDTEKFRRYEEQIVKTFKDKVLATLKIPQDCKILLFVGSEQPRKNLGRVIEALYILKHKYNINCKLIKIGKALPHERERSINIVNKLGLHNDVFFIDYVPDEELPLYYNLADCLVLPTTFEGGFALPVLEALACKTPVVTSKIEPIEEVTKGGKGVLMVNPYKVEEIAKATFEILTNDELREEKINDGYKIAKQYSWEIAAEELYKVYRELIK